MLLSLSRRLATARELISKSTNFLIAVDDWEIELCSINVVVVDTNTDGRDE